jgi:hypothetical protein
MSVSPDSSWTPGELLCIYFYNHAHRPRLGALSHLELPRSFNGHFNRFWIQVAVSLLKPRGGYLTAVAAGQSQRFYSCVGIFNWHYLSLPPQIPRGPWSHLEPGGLMCSSVKCHKEAAERQQGAKRSIMQVRQQRLAGG